MIPQNSGNGKNTPPGGSGGALLKGKGGKTKGIPICEIGFNGETGDAHLAKRLTTPTTTSSAASAANTRFSAISSASFLVSSLT